MVWRPIARLWAKIGHFEVSRYWQVHILIGSINVSIYFVGTFIGFGYYIATAAGHLTHAGLAFYFDRFYTYRALDVRKAISWWKYGVVDVVAFLIINWFLWEFATKQGYDSNLVRWGPAMFVAGGFHFLANKYWTFRSVSEAIT